VKRLLIGLMLLVTATAASAEWARVDDNDDFIQYVDRATIRRNGYFVKMWGLQDYKTVQKLADDSYLASKEQREYDCKEERTRLLAFLWFSGQMGSGKVVLSNSDTSMKWDPVVPGSVGEILWKVACGKK
jgi:hypothetical protein